MSLKALVTAGLIGTFTLASPVLAQTGQSETGQTETGQTEAGQSETGQSETGQSEAEPVLVDPNAVVVNVAGTDVTEADLQLAAEDFAAFLADIPEAERRDRLIDLVIDLNLFAKAARDAGLDDSADFQQRMRFLEMRTLRSVYVEEELANTITDADIKARYDVEIAQIPVEELISARHILVESEDEAKAIIADLEGGADFASLAQERSTGPSGPNGGDLGQFGRGQMVPAFEQAAFALEPGNFTKEPVQTQFGWHVILTYDKGSQPLPTLEQVRDQVRNMVIADRFQAQLDTLKETYEVKRAE